MKNKNYELQRLNQTNVPCIRHIEREYWADGVSESPASWGVRTMYGDATEVQMHIYDAYSDAHEDHLSAFNLYLGYIGGEPSNGCFKKSDNSFRLFFFVRLDDDNLRIGFMVDTFQVHYSKKGGISLGYMDEDHENIKNFKYPLSAEDRFEIMLTYSKIVPDINVELIEWLGNLIIDEIAFNNGFI